MTSIAPPPLPSILPLPASDWLHGFVLPLVAGGDVRVRCALGARELRELNDTALDDDANGRRIAEARHGITSEILIGPPEPRLDDEALRLAVAMQDLLFLLHPARTQLGVRRGKLRALSRFATAMAALAPPALDDEGARCLAERHSLLHHLLDLGRDDVRVSFWVGRREFKGAEPPARLLKWPDLRRVREERWRVTLFNEAMTDPLARPVAQALLAASPLTDLWSPERGEPRLDLGPLAGWLRVPALARALADRYLGLGLGRVGSPWAQAVLALCSEPETTRVRVVAPDLTLVEPLPTRPLLPPSPAAIDRRAAARLCIAFACHLQLLSLVGPRPRSERELYLELQGLTAAQPGLRDFYGLFAAADRLGLARPADLPLDHSLTRLVDAYAAACTTLVGSERLAELHVTLARGAWARALAS